MKEKFTFGFGNIFSPEKNVSALQMSLTLVMVISLILSNILVNKSIDLFGIESLPNTCSMFVFPITYILSDIFSEVYGYKWSRVTATWAFLGTIMCSLFFALSIKVEGNAAFLNQEAFEVVLGNTPQIALASVIAYWCGDWANDKVFQVLKKMSKGNPKLFAVRAIGSSLVGKYVDGAIFTFIGLSFLPLTTKILMVATAPFVQICLETILLPVTILLKNAIQKKENKIKQENIQKSVA